MSPHSSPKTARTRIAVVTLAFLLGAAATPAAAGQDALQALYGLADQRVKAAGEQSAGAQGKQGGYGPANLRVAPSPVQTVLRLRQMPDGTLAVECHIEHADHAHGTLPVVHTHREVE